MDFFSERRKHDNSARLITWRPDPKQITGGEGGNGLQNNIGLGDQNFVIISSGFAKTCVANIICQESL